MSATSRVRARGAREALWILAALLFGLAVSRVAGLEGDDPLRGTVTLAPAVLAALWRIEDRVRNRGGRRARPGVRLVEGFLLLTWLLAASHRPGWNLRFGAEVLAGTWFLGLGWKVLRLLPTLRPSLGTALPERPPAVFFWLPLVVYLAILPWSTGQRPPDGDEPYYLLVAHSLAFDGDTDLRDDYAEKASLGFMPRALEPQPGDPMGSDGEIYSRHNALLPMMLALPYRVAGAQGAFVVMAVLTAVLAWWFLRLCAREFPARPGEALLAWALLAFAPPILLYSHQVWVEIPAALLVAIGWDLVSWRDEEGEGRRWLLLLGVVTLLTLLKLRLLLLAVPLLLLGAARSRRRMAAIGGASVFLVLAGGFLLYNQTRFGNPLRIYSTADFAFHQISWTTYLEREVGLFFDGAFGLFAVAPLWLILIPGLVAGVRRHRTLLLRLAVLLGPYLVVVASREEWFGGWSPPFRYGLLGLPLLALLVIPPLSERRRLGARALLSGLGVLTAALTLVWLTVPGWTYNLADGGSDLADALSRLLGLDFNRLLPSTVRPRTATWLWPLILGFLLPLLWWRPRRRLGAASTLGLAGLLLVAGGGAGLAARMPTRIVEMEDPPVVSDDGRLHPPRWTVARVREPSGLLLPEGASARVPVVAGGDRVHLVLRVRLIENHAHPTPLTIGDGHRVFRCWKARVPGEWLRVAVGPVDWIPGRELHLEVPSPPPGRAGNGLVVDWGRFEWR